MLFLESVRGFEFFHPEVGEKILSRTHRILNRHATVFTEGYSSSINAGQTVRGQFSTFCSMLPNMGGAATYIAYNSEARYNTSERATESLALQTASLHEALEPDTLLWMIPTDYSGTETGDYLERLGAGLEVGSDNVLRESVTLSRARGGCKTAPGAARSLESDRGHSCG